MSEIQIDDITDAATDAYYHFLRQTNSPEAAATLVLCVLLSEMFAAYKQSKA